MADTASTTGARELPRDLAEQLDRLAEETGRADLRHAARVLRDDRIGGRPAAKDAEALQTVMVLISHGTGPWSACMIVARRLGADKPESVARRLFNKIPKKGIFSGSPADSVE